MPSTPVNGKIAYIEIPAIDIQRSADFYAKVFGWRIKKRGDGSTAFDDTTGQVSGTWVAGWPPSAEPGLLIYIMVDSIDATVDAIIREGGHLAASIEEVDAPHFLARFHDPAGNIFGLYQEPHA